MSPISKPKKTKKSKLDRSKTPHLTAPLSILTKDMETPMKDMDEWVHRPAEVRRQEVEKRNGYVTRPMNSFMLYRSAYAERTKQWCLQNNHQVVSSVSGESWPMEPPEVREQFNEWAKIERANHAAAHPDYKFSPGKAASKRRKEDASDDDEPDGLDDPDGDYVGSRSVRRRQNKKEPAFLPSSHGFESTPYYSQQNPVYDQPQYQYVTQGRPLPSNVAYDHQGIPYNPQTGAYMQPIVAQQPQYQYAVQEPLPPREPTPQSLGNYGLPSGQTQEQLFTHSRTSTPMQQYNQYGQPVYAAQYQSHQYQPAYQPNTPQMYEHAQYLQAQMQPQQAIDPSLEIMVSDAAAHGESHFETALGDMTGDLGVLEYYDQQTGPDATLAPSWSPTDGLK
jgi:peptidoglycan/xylan/chitin deacetylase (PgdA/CDA1 family)